MSKHTTAVLTGRCANGAERDRGRLQHVAEVGSFGKALCGRAPGRLSNGWAAATDNFITCPACLKKWRKEFMKETKQRMKAMAEVHEKEANARLIAAAPELLEALKFLAADYLAIDGPEITHSRLPIRKAINAIAKAEGNGK